MISGAEAGGRHAELAGIGLGVSNELGHRANRHRGVDLDEEGFAGHARNRRDVTNEVELEVLVERVVGGVGKTGLEQRITVGWRLHHRLGGNVGAGAGPVLDDELLA